MKALSAKGMNHEGTKTQREPVGESLELLAREVVDASFQVHKTLGPGLLESVCEACLCHELKKRNVPFRRQVVLPVVYDGMEIEAGLRIDLIVNDALVVELKAVDDLCDVHKAQLMTYMKLTRSRLGLSINFNVPVIKQGIRRVIL